MVIILPKQEITLFENIRGTVKHENNKSAEQGQRTELALYCIV